MAERIEIRKEAIARQGSTLKQRRTRYFIEGDKKKAKFQMGEEGLVHYAVDQGSGTKYRIKCFWEPDDGRLARSRYLVKQRLADLKNGSVDVLAGAPFGLIDSIGGLSRFALIMKNVEGGSWKDLRQDAENLGVYPPPDWPSFKIRVLWAYGLACAVERMEARNFVHADLSDGNIVVVEKGDRAGQMALVDFDAYFNPAHPSQYRGTSGFVAPEIWDRGPVGVGSDRVAMAILIQDMLVVGDPEASAEVAFAGRYTQEQICAYQGTAHPLLKQRYREVADLLEATLRAANPSLRPEPKLWREALLRLYSQPPNRYCRLDAFTGGAGMRIALNAGGMQDLRNTPFGIRANLERTQDGALRLRIHAGARVRIQTPREWWREVGGGSDVAVIGDAMIFDPEGKLPVKLTVVEEPEETAATKVGPESFETAAARAGRGLVRDLNWRQVAYFLLGLLAVVLVFAIARLLD
jgi:hypothetical protein